MAKIKFNIKNVKYAVPNSDGSYEGVSPKSLGGAHQLTLNGTYSEKPIYADGLKAFVLASDQGLTGSLIMTYLSDDYEIDMGRKMRITGGLADIQQLAAKEHAIYFEIHEQEQNDSKATLKCWLFNVTSGKPTEIFTQDQEEPTPNNYEIPITVLGTLLRDETGTNNYVDANGNTLLVWRITASPTDDGYSTFGNSVPVPKVTAE